MGMSIRSVVHGACAALLPWLGTGVAAAPVVTHDPATCAVSEAFPVIEARLAEPAPGARLRVLFRLDRGDEWYAVAMTDEADVWRGLLPRPEPGLAGFSYVVEAAVGAERSRTAENRVLVMPAGAACPGVVAESVASAQVTVEVPAGAPVIPPVPRGFSPVGAVNARAEALAIPRRASRRLPLLLAGVALAGGGAVAASQGEPNGPPPTAPFDPRFDNFFSDVMLIDASPPPGTALSLAAPSLDVRVQIRLTQTTEPVFVEMRLEDDAGRACLVATLPVPGLGPSERRDLDVVGFEATGLCPAPAQVTHGAVTIRDYTGSRTLFATGNSNRSPHLALRYDLVP